MGGAVLGRCPCLYEKSDRVIGESCSRFLAGRCRFFARAFPKMMQITRTPSDVDVIWQRTSCLWDASAPEEINAIVSMAMSLSGSPGNPATAFRNSHQNSARLRDMTGYISSTLEPDLRGPYRLQRHQTAKGNACG